MPSAQTYFANLTASIGFMAIFYIVLLFSNNKKTSSTQDRTAQFFLYSSIMFFSLFQMQITNPTLWLLISLCKKDSFDVKR